MSGSCCGGCGGQDAEPTKEKAGEKDQTPEQEKKQDKG
jgi:hypothetical protein